MTIIKKFEPEEPKKSFSKKYVSLVVVLLLCLTLAEIWTNNTVVIYGEKFEKLSELAKQLDFDNQILENQIAQYTSLGSIASKSAQLGFVPPESIQYIR